jgi:hypothetical protein
MTDPVPCGWHRYAEAVKRVLRKIKRRIHPLPEFAALATAKYRGHAAVTRSMVEGLKKIGVPCSYNPRNREQVGDVVIVPGGFAALRQAIQLKKGGLIRRLLVGTNLVDFPSERPNLMCAPEIDFHLVPSDWVRDNFIRDCPELKGRVFCWPAGVDVRYWSPSDIGNERCEVLIYEKPMEYLGQSIQVGPYVRKIEERGYKVRRMQYERYLPDQYLENLRRAHVLVGFSLKETQGIAWAEAWSVGVPTLLWNQESIVYKGRKSRASTGPYLTDQTGLFFYGLNEFESTWHFWEQVRNGFRPREWVIENMSDEICAKKLCKLAGIT